MASSTFTPNTRVSADSNPRDWAYELACLPQKASIVFTKESLLAFLKTHNIDVGPNYAEISKVPRYATIGTMSEVAAENASAVLAPQQEQTPAPVLGEVLASFPAATAVPTASSRPETEAPAAKSVTPPARQEQLPPQTQPQPQRQESHPTPTTESAFRPSRRVREPIGGGSALISALFGGSADDEERHNEAVREAARENARRRGLLQERATEQQTQSPELAKPSVKDSAAVPDAITAEIVDNRENIEKLEAFRPTRRVREPGGTGGSSSITLG